MKLLYGIFQTAQCNPLAKAWRDTEEQHMLRVTNPQHPRLSHSYVLLHLLQECHNDITVHPFNYLTTHTHTHCLTGADYKGVTDTYLGDALMSLTAEHTMHTHVLAHTMHTLSPGENGSSELCDVFTKLCCCCCFASPLSSVLGLIRGRWRRETALPEVGYTRMGWRRKQDIQSVSFSRYVGSWSKIVLWKM